MLAASLHPLLWLFGCVLLRGTTASTEPSGHAVAGQPQTTTHSAELKNHTSEPSTSVKSTTSAGLNLTSLDPTTTTTYSTTSTTTLTSSVLDEKSKGSRTTVASSTQGQEPKRSKSTATSTTQGTSERTTPTPESSGYLPMPTPTDGKSPLTVAAFGVISFIVILIVVVIILVAVVSLRFKCNRLKDSEAEDELKEYKNHFQTRIIPEPELFTPKQYKQKPGSNMVSESCSASTREKDNSITLISMKNINMNNSRSYPPSEKVL